MLEVYEIVAVIGIWDDDIGKCGSPFSSFETVGMLGKLMLQAPGKGKAAETRAPYEPWCA